MFVDTMFPQLQEARLAEPIPDPALPVVDAHHHLYEVNPWTDSGRGYLLDDFVGDLASGHNVVATVYVECGQHILTAGPQHLRTTGEAAFVASIAQDAQKRWPDSGRICDAFVGRVNLMMGEAVEEVICALDTASGGRLRGIRSPAAWDADPRVGQNSRAFAEPHIMTTSAFRNGLDTVTRYGLAFDAWQFYPQLMELAELARACPEATIVVGHCGGLIGLGPYAGAGNFDAWKARIEELARCPNIVMKLGGLSSGRTGFGFQERSGPVPEDELIEAWEPYILTCIEAFGPGRCMFESNFPVEMVATDYATLWSVFKKIVSGASPDEKRALFSGTARQIYQIT